MKRFLIGTVILTLVTIGAFAQNAAYKENLEKAKSFEAQKKWVNALASYYDAMSAEPSEKAEEAFDAYNKLADSIKSGMPGYGEMDEFAIYDGWMEIAGEWEKYWKANCPVYFKCGTIEKGELDMETRTGSYNASLISSYTSKYKELYDVVLEGWKKAYRSEWKGCRKEALKLTDSPEDRKYTVNANVVDAEGKVFYSLFEKELDKNTSTNSSTVYKWIIKNVSRDKMKEIDAANCFAKPTGVSWTVNGKKSSYNLGKVEIVGVNGDVNSNAVFLVKCSLATIIEMIFVEGGTFQMGSANGDRDEKPVHNVSLSSFYIGKTEVTQAQWKAVMGNNPSNFKEDDRPVENVSWYDAMVFCNKRSKMDGKTPVYNVNGKTDPDLWNYTPCQGKSISGHVTMDVKATGYRLPTEAEWEYAASGGNERKGYKYSGSDNLESVAWYDGNSGKQTHYVASKVPNELGLYDMSGNVWEWCWDWYDSNYYGESSSNNPTGTSLGSSRIMRGGSYNVYGNNYRCSVIHRESLGPSSWSNVLGFRVVCSTSEMISDMIEQERLEKEVLLKNLTESLVFVQGGTFQMGSADGDSDEKPVHDVTLSSYYIGKTEVTQAQWRAVMGNNPSNSKGDKLPVEQVSWYDAIVFCNKLSIKTGKIPVYSVDGETDPDLWNYIPCQSSSISGNIEMDLEVDGYRLPTEAEWEYAAKGGNKSKGYKYAGSNYLESVAWKYDIFMVHTQDVATKASNELGIYDMSGNVCEWCWDKYGNYNNSSTSNPVGALTGDYRVTRGGHFLDTIESDLRVTERGTGRWSPSIRSNYCGFRIVFSINGQERLEQERKESEVLGKYSESLVFVEGDSFQMGGGGNSGYKNEKPKHNVSLSSFYIGKTEVTQTQWKAVMGNNPSNSKGDKLPVEQVSWYDAIVFCNKLSIKTEKIPVYSVDGETDPDLWNYTPCNGESIDDTIMMNMNANGYRLPTEAEWEYAASGGKKSKGFKFSGSNKLKEVAWYKDNSGNKIHEVATKAPNELGIYDMSGNVWEWCWDWYDSDYYNKSSATNPKGPLSGSNRIVRGGGNFVESSSCRVAGRFYNYPNLRIYGFRVVCSAVDE